MSDWPGDTAPLPHAAAEDRLGARLAGMRVHNHPPYRPVCNERDVDGQLRGACLNDNGSDA